MVALILFILMAIAIIIAIEFRERKKKKGGDSTTKHIPSDCCGEHLVCERESLLNTDNKIIYYDDEELDELKNIEPQEYTEEQIKLFEEVFYSLKDTDVAGWAKSLQLRNIYLPEDIREQALMIIREQRNKK